MREGGMRKERMLIRENERDKKKLSEREGWVGKKKRKTKSERKREDIGMRETWKWGKGKKRVWKKEEWDKEGKNGKRREKER